MARLARQGSSRRGGAHDWHGGERLARTSLTRRASARIGKAGKASQRMTAPGAAGRGVAGGESNGADWNGMTRLERITISTTEIMNGRKDTKSCTCST